MDSISKVRPSEFPDTNWTMVLASDREASAAGRLCTLYWVPIYTYLRRDGKSPHDAEDIGRKIGKSAGAVRIAVFRLRKRFANTHSACVEP
jgi:hypothetical protein